MFAQRDITLDVIGPQRLLEPGDVIVMQHASGLDGPLVLVGPILTTPASVYHELYPITDCLASRSDQSLVVVAADQAKLAPSHLDRPEPPRDEASQGVGEHLGGPPKDDRGVRLDPVTVVPSQQTPNRLARLLPQQIPQSDIEPADCVRHSAASALPESHLVEFLRDPLWLDSRFADDLGREQSKSTVNQRRAGVAATHANEASICLYLHERV